MSLEAQERALFSLLFDAELRARFLAEPEATLAGLDLDADERADFLCIRPAALELDAELRRDLLLQKLCRSLPLSFALLSSFARLDAARALVDVSHVITPPGERTLGFARRLRDVFEDLGADARVLAVVDAEVALQAISAARRRDPGDEPGAVALGEAPLQLAPHVAAAILPRAYDPLLAGLCPGSLDQLWARLSAQPLSPAARTRALAGDAPVLLVARAVCTRRSRCEATVDLRRVELPGGFAPLLAQLPLALAELLARLRAAGAGEAIIAGVRQGFVQLAAHGMVRS